MDAHAVHTVPGDRAPCPAATRTTGLTVTESKLLRDAVLGIEREIDIVVEGEFDGEPMVISIEVIERGRPATLSWVQEMIAKHRGLPTNRLLLGSKSGFTRNALAGPRITESCPTRARSGDRPGIVTATYGQTDRPADLGRST